MPPDDPAAALREARGDLTQAAFAAALGLSLPYLRKLERGQVSPGPAMTLLIEALADGWRPNGLKRMMTHPANS